jgi:hypothetical protein
MRPRGTDAMNADSIRDLIGRRSRRLTRCRHSALDAGGDEHMNRRASTRDRAGVARRPAERVLLVAGGANLLSAGYLLSMVAAAWLGRRRGAGGPTDAPALRFIVLIPAHDEESALPDTLDAVAALDYPRDLVEVVVIADNCSDGTAALARAHGAIVLERRSGERGKGAAVAWALDQVAGHAHDAVLFLDADCIASANLLRAIESRMRAGARAAQAAYVVANPTESWPSALRFASFSMINTVRPWGRDVLGLSAGILGTGFAIDRSVLHRYGWRAFSLTEDSEYHLQLLRAGIRVRFAPEARVSSPMPTSLRASHAQHARWESGKLAMLRGGGPRLLEDGVRAGDAQLVHAAVDGMIPPQSALAASSASIALAGALLRSTRVTRLGLAAAAAQVAYVLGGLWLVRAPLAVYRALAAAPVLVAWKLPLYTRMLAGRAPRGWVRTER